MALSRRKRKRAKARGDRPKAGAYTRVRGGLRADWTKASVEDAALIRQSLRESWPGAKGEAIIDALTSAISPTDRPRQAIRVTALILAIEKHYLRRAQMPCKT